MELRNNGFADLMVDVYDTKTRAILDNQVDARVRRLWFENYEKNKATIAEHGDICQIPSTDADPAMKTIMCIGAGWSLGRTLPKLKGIKVPMIVCDKSAARVVKYGRPLAVTALNTEKTRVREWLKAFKKEMKKHHYSMDDVWLVVPVTVDPDIFDEWNGSKIAFVNPANTCDELIALVERETKIPPTLRGDNVGFFSVITAFTLGAENILFLGMNYCFQSAKKTWEVTNGNHCIAIRDVRDKIVYTTLDWIQVRTEFVNFCMDTLSGPTKYVNCSEGGILYEVDVIHASDLGVWRTFLHGDEIQNDNKAAKKRSRPRKA